MSDGDVQPAEWIPPAVSAQHPFRLCVAVLLAFFLALWVARLFLHEFNGDEFEGIHTAWKTAHGERIYRDFFQHHNPLMYQLLAPVVRAGGEHVHTLFLCRFVMLGCALITLFGTFNIARHLFGTDTALLAIVLLAASPTFVIYHLQVRPDVPQTAVTTFAIFYFLRRCRSFDYVISGLLFAIAFLFLQKAIFPILGICAVGTYRLLAGKDTAINAACFALGLLLPLLLAALWLPVSFQEYWFLNWTLNASFLNEISPYPVIQRVIANQPHLIIFACLGISARFSELKLELLVVILAIVVAITFVTRSSHDNYWLPLFPLFAVVAAPAILLACSAFPKPRRSLLVFLAVTLGWSAVLLRYELVSKTNTLQIERIAYVLERTKPGDALLDGSMQFNVFRPDVDWFWFSLGPKHSLGTYRLLRSYEYDPVALIIEKKPLFVHPELLTDHERRAIAAYYSPTRFPEVWQRKPPE